MLTFFKRERALRMLPWSALLTVVLVAPLSGLFASGIHGPTEGDLTGIHGLLAMMSLQAVLLVAARDFPLRTRVREFERSLPVTMRRVVLERLASVWLTLFATFLAGSLVWFVKMPAETALGNHAMLLWRGFVASGVSAALLGCYRPTRPELSTPETVLVSIVSVAAWLYSGFGSFAGRDLAYFVALVGLLTYLWNALPVTSAALDPSVKGEPAASTESSGSPATATFIVRALGPLRWTILRSSLLRPQVVLMTVAVAFFLWAGQGNSILVLMFLAMLPYLAMRMGLNVLFGLDAFPIRREKVLRVAGLSSLALLAVITASFSRADRLIMGFEILAWGVEVDRCSEEVWGEEQARSLHVKVPASEWRMTRHPADALVTAPWGETAVPTLHPIFPGAGIFTYNPYDVQPENTGRFLVWQVTRALDQVHGPKAQRNDHHQAWLDTIELDEPIANARIKDASSAQWGHDVIEHSETPNAAGFAALGAVLIWLLTTGFTLLPNVPSLTAPAWLSRLPRGTAGTIAIGALVLPLFMMEMRDRSLQPVLLEQAHAWIDARLGSSPLLWTALILSLTGVSYAFLAWRIQRIEVPPLARNGWTKKPMPIY